MTCRNQGLVAVVYDLSTPSLVRGGDLYVTTQVQYAGGDPSAPGDPYSFDGLTACSANFTGNVGVVSATGSVLSNDLGLVKFAIPAADSGGLAVGDQLQFEQVFQDARGVTILLVPAPPVVAQLF